MEGSIKTRQAGSLPKTVGRQVGVLPIRNGTNVRKENCVPEGETDILSESQCSYHPKHASGRSSKPGSSNKYQTSAKIPSNGDTPSSTLQITEHDQTPVTKNRASQSSRHTAARPPKETISQPYSASLKKLPGSVNTKDGIIDAIPDDSSNIGDRKSSTCSSKVTSSRTPPVSSRSVTGSAGQSPAVSNASTQRSGRKVHSGMSVGQGSWASNIIPEQDIRFTDVPSSQSSMSGQVQISPRRVPSSVSSVSEQELSGRKPAKTIDPEEILVKNMESDFNKIYEINLHASTITYISNLEKFRKLKVLDLSCNFIEKIQNFEFCKDLKELKLYDNRLTMIDGLQNLKELNTLQLQHNKIKSLGKGLNCMKSLKTLRLDCNRLLRIEPPELSQCVQLTSLDISYNMLDSLTALNYLPNLEEVNASGNRLRSVSNLSKCKQLQEIDLSGNRLTDLSGLRGLPKLLALNISNNLLTSLKTIGKLKALQDLFAGANLIHDLSMIATILPMLEVLDVTDNEITDWDEFYSLEEMPQLIELFISGNPFCAQDGPMPHYFGPIQEVLPNLEILDGAHVKKHIAKGVPLMRPMSASTVVSLRQMENHMKNTEEQMRSLENSLEEKFAALRASCDTLPAESPRQSFTMLAVLGSGKSTPASSRCSSKSRIMEARKFASSATTK